MRGMIVAVLLISGLLSGCAHNYFNVPYENLADRIKVLGIIPIMVDADSDIRHPQKEQLSQIVTEMNRKYEQQFVRKVKGTGNFYTVALMDGSPELIFSNLLFRREKRDDATIQYNKYFWKNEELRDYIRKNNLDAVMAIVVSGLTRSDKIYSGNLFSTSLTSDYNFLTMTAQILDQNGTILWEYPNFRRRFLTYYPMINLQYPDFSEAEANLLLKASLKFRTLDGIRRLFEQKRKDIMLHETQVTEIYSKQFNEMLDLLKYDSEADKKGPSATTEKPQPSDLQPKGAEQSATGAVKAVKPPEALPVAESTGAAVTNIEPKKQPVVEEQKPLENVIVPATGSTL